MKNLFNLLIVSVTVSLTGCGTINPILYEATYAENMAGYTYVPLEPSSVALTCRKALCVKTSDNQEPRIELTKKNLLNALPDNSVRMATRQISGSGSFGAQALGAAVGVKGNSYEVIIDYVNTQTINSKFAGRWFVDISDDVANKDLKRCYPYEMPVLKSAPTNDREYRSLIVYPAPLTSLTDKFMMNTFFKEKIQPDDNLRYSGEQIINRCPPNISSKFEDRKSGLDIFNVPVYVGIGLRLKANVTVLDGTVNLSSLPALSAAVSAGKATGSMSVQTLGISGKAARGNLLLLDKIDSTTIQNAIQVLASIKSLIESEDTTITPRIVGFHNTIGAGPQGVNLLQSILTSDSSISLNLDSDKYASGTFAQ